MLAERFEDDLGLLARDADAGVVDLEQHPARRVRLDRQTDTAVLGELDRIGQQVLENLLQTLAIDDQLRRRIGFGRDLQGQTFLPRQWLEGFAQALQHRAGRYRFIGQFHVPGFDLGQIQNVVDQCQQIVVGRENGLRIFHLLGAERAFLVVGQQLGQDQRTVERRA